jgi:N-(2-amino-2-carboxyethyl)-L-glutamate synthase
MINNGIPLREAVFSQFSLIERLEVLEGYIGNTPIRKLTDKKAEIYVKIEYNNYSGSIKDRAVFNILRSGIKRGDIHENTTIVESSSGNFAISLASMCRVIGLKCIVVIDPNINRDYELLLNKLADKVIKVTERDETGGYLLTRINKVNELCASDSSTYWTNQYDNADNYLAYYNGMGVEICNAFTDLDYVFIGVSTCGTIAGISRRIKEKYPKVVVVAVDVEGSVIFGQPPKKRYISGLGSSKVPGMTKNAIIDEVVYVAEANVVKGCCELLETHTIFGGGSTGAMYYAVKDFLQKNSFTYTPRILFLCPDKGAAYMDTIYNENWVTAHFPENDLAVVSL